MEYSIHKLQQKSQYWLLLLLAKRRCYCFVNIYMGNNISKGAAKAIQCTPRIPFHGFHKIVLSGGLRAVFVASFACLRVRLQTAIWMTYFYFIFVSISIWAAHYWGSLQAKLEEITLMINISTIEICHFSRITWNRFPICWVCLVIVWETI